MKIHTVGIVGYGHFGAFVYKVATQHVKNVSVKVYSRRALGLEVQATTLKEVAQSDVVIVCSAIREYKESLTLLKDHLAPSSVVVDVATVKQYTQDLIQEMLPEQPYVCTHPMFGPESYRKNGDSLEHLRLVITKSNLNGPHEEALFEWLQSFGLEVIPMSADEHDRKLAESLFLTHFVSQSVIEAGFERTVIDTPSFSSLMNAVDSVRNDGRLFADVFRFNPYCQSVVDRLHVAQEAIYVRIKK